MQEPQIIEDDCQVINSEYETASEFQPDFESDAEPPQDKIQEKKMIHKDKTFRVYKKILKLGAREWFMPAKYDRIQYKHKICKVETEEKEFLDDVE